MKTVEPLPKWPPEHPKETCCERHLDNYKERLVKKVQSKFGNILELATVIKTIIYQT